MLFPRRPLFTGDGANEGGPPGAKANAILAPTLGSLNVLAQLAPIFPAKPPLQQQLAACHDAAGDGGNKPTHDTVEQRGDLRLSIANSGEEYPWTFIERPQGGTTVSGQAPPGLGFPEGGRVYLVWELPNTVKWQFAGGFVEEIPPRATWTVAPVRDAAPPCAAGKEEEEEKGATGGERAPIASAPPAAA